MDALGARCSCPVGFSDPTLGIEIAVAAAARGAAIIEKHLTLDKTLPGPDHRASLDPVEFAAMVRAIRAVAAARRDEAKSPLKVTARPAHCRCQKSTRLNSSHSQISYAVFFL